MLYTHHCLSPLGEILLAADDVGLTGLWFTQGQKHMGMTRLRKLEVQPCDRLSRVD